MNEVIKVFKKDGRSKTGERLFKELKYRGMSGNAMMDEVKYLRLSKYKVEDGYRVVW